MKNTESIIKLLSTILDIVNKKAPEIYPEIKLLTKEIEKQINLTDDVDKAVNKVKDTMSMAEDFVDPHKNPLMKNLMDLQAKSDQALVDAELWHKKIQQAAEDVKKEEILNSLKQLSSRSA